MTNADVLGIDFGTSNSAVGVLIDGAPRLVQVEDGKTTMPTSVFFDFEAQKTIFGSRANAALINGDDGRFMRALKSVLGTPLMHEPRRMMGETLTLVDVVSRFLHHLRESAQARFDRPFHRVVAGRPVRFHSNDQDRDAQALVDLKECYRRAGFDDVRFLYEPEAAALAASRNVAGDGWKLIVDIGGGTSDFTLYRDKAAGGIEIASSFGIRLGGTDFDRQLSYDHVMPLLGLGSQLRNAFGGGVLDAPKAIFRDLATWQLIPFLYTPEGIRKVAKMELDAEQPELFSRLRMVLEDRLGHDIAFEVERAKIEANEGACEQALIDLGVIERGLEHSLTRAASTQSLTGLIADIGGSTQEILAQADLTAKDIETVVFVGGSSLLPSVQTAVQQVLPDADFSVSDVFTAIVDGLTIAAGNVE